jgi:type II secretory pathway pseudopilin PulG
MNNKGFTPLEITNSHGQNNMQGKKPKQGKSLTGFTLLEVIIAMFIVTMGVGAVFVLVNQTLNSSGIISSRFIAIYLAQEGIELVREIRDSNFLKINNGAGGASWDAGLTNCQAGCEADYNDANLIFNNRYLKIDGGFYNYDLGTDTTFKRKITITTSTADILEISVEASWQEQGRAHQVTVKENLYNWMK